MIVLYILPKIQTGQEGEQDKRHQVHNTQR